MATNASDPIVILSYARTPMGSFQGSLAGADTFTGTLTRVAGEDVGSYAIEQGSLELSTNYSLTFIGADLSITARQLTITPGAGQFKVYGDTGPVLAYDVTDGWPVSRRGTSCPM